MVVPHAMEASITSPDDRCDSDIRASISFFYKNGSDCDDNDLVSNKRGFREPKIKMGFKFPEYGYLRANPFRDAIVDEFIIQRSPWDKNHGTGLEEVLFDFEARNTCGMTENTGTFKRTKKKLESEIGISMKGYFNKFNEDNDLSNDCFDLEEPIGAERPCWGNYSKVEKYIINGKDVNVLKVDNLVPCMEKFADKGVEKLVIYDAGGYGNTWNKLSILENFNDLKEIHMDSTELKNLVGIGKIKNLEKLFMKGASVDDLTAVNGSLRLKEIDIEQGVMRFSDFSLPTLEKLTLGGSYARSIPKLDLPRLKELDIGFNSIQKIENLEKLEKLEKLVLQKNEIDTIENIDHLKKLKHLNLSDNYIGRMKNLDNLKKLEHLKIDKNGLRRVEGIESLQRLKTFSAIDNKIESARMQREGSRKPKNDVYPHSLETLDLSLNQISHVHIDMPFPNLKKLFLSGNRLGGFTGDGSKFENLERLVLTHNQIPLLEYVKPNNVKEIDLKDNPFMEMDPEWFGKTKLEHVEIRDVPENVRNKLKELYGGTFQSNKLKELFLRGGKINFSFGAVA